MSFTFYVLNFMFVLRRESDSNRRMEVLQTPVLTTSPPRHVSLILPFLASREQADTENRPIMGNTIFQTFFTSQFLPEEKCGIAHLQRARV